MVPSVRVTTLFGFGSLRDCGSALQFCSCRRRWLRSRNMVPSATLTALPTEWFCLYVWLRSGLLFPSRQLASLALNVLSASLATLRGPGSINGRGYAPKICFRRGSWLRSDTVVLSSRLATLPIYGSVDAIGYAPLNWFRRVLWLRSS